MIGRALAVTAGLLCFVAIPVHAQQTFSLSANPASGPAPLSVTFTVSPPPPTDSAVDFGDGSEAAQVRGAQVTHVYRNGGDYVARLSAGAAIVATVKIAVGSASR
jgi:PKD repeat protein